MIELRPITADDVREIKKWPPYRGGFEQMDYALREGGWLDEFRDRTDAHLWAVLSGGSLVGFSLLSVTETGTAEFRIAVHPDLIGRGMGRKIALATLERAFRGMGLARVRLIVRTNNPRAQKLYERIGFLRTGESMHRIQGKDIPFIDMEIIRDQYDDLSTREDL